MTCRECAEFLADYVAGELAAEAVVTFERHLGACRNCRVYMKQYRLTIQAGKTACDTDSELHTPPEELIRAILEARRAMAED